MLPYWGMLAMIGSGDWVRRQTLSGRFNLLCGGVAVGPFGGSDAREFEQLREFRASQSSMSC